MSRLEKKVHVHDNESVLLVVISIYLFGCVISPVGPFGLLYKVKYGIVEIFVPRFA